uniref:NADH-ubiquinone oxidoreductase chain 4L n=1 Tax=Quadristernoseta cf. longigynium XFX-2019 TaxID=2695872 RepID=A0A6B9WCE4_9ACAR|nr:NADH dehydrogenase subunit 4L [Quadristernoseta cf. longigynium XFX-2019]
MMIIGFWIYIFGILSLVANRNHLLLLLLSFEMMMIGTLFIFLVMMGGMSEILCIMIYLVFVVCEAMLGLGLMVMVVYYYGGDYVKSCDLL